MIDFNNQREIKELQEAMSSNYGQLVLKYLQQVTDEKTDYSNIDFVKDNDLVGEEVKVYKKTKEIVKEIINYFN